jgi:predicted alpha/beta-fold hydrolase
MSKTISRLKVAGAYWLFRTPFPIPLPPSQRKKVKRAESKFNRMLDREVTLKGTRSFRAYSFNPTGKKRALVVHGWLSRSLYMVELIEALTQSGYHVVAIDLPGHGRSKWGPISWKDSVNAILEAQRFFDGFDLALGHSYGGAMILNSTAIENEVQGIEGYLDVEEIILVASPVKIETAVNLFSNKLKLSKDEVRRLTERVEADAGVPISRLDAVYLQNEYPTQTRIHCLHDRSDTIVPFDDSTYLRELGDRVTLKEFSDLGHLRIIYAPEATQHLRERLAT